MLSWLIAYLVTCAVEIPIVVLLLRRLGWCPAGAVPATRATGLAWSLQVTHPVLWLVNPGSLGGVLVAEALIVMVEAAALCWWAVARMRVAPGPDTWRRALLVSLVANAASFAVGLVPSLTALTY